jgi:hypothetical protein
MEGGGSFPVLRQVVLDTTEPRVLAEFYRRLLGYTYRSGDEPSAGTDGRADDFVVVHHASGRPRIAFQQVEALAESTWPNGDVPQQLHLDMSVNTVGDLDFQHKRALELGARLVLDRSDDHEEPLRVYADPAGHPFCILVAAS